MDQAEYDKMKAELKAELAKEYEAKGKWLRNWITEHPLPAARIALALGSVLTAVAIFGVQALWALFSR